MVEVAPIVTGLPERADAVIIGSGFAGCAAAVRLAERGSRVLVVEEAPRLGGRATSFVDRDSGERVDNGQHALFGCYRDTYELLGTLGVADRAPLQPSLSVTMADRTGRTATLTCPPLPAPWHLLAGVLRWSALGLADRLAVMKLRRFLRDVQAHGAEGMAAAVSPALTVTAWLRANGQTDRLCEWLWSPLAIAALNQSPDVAAAAPFVRVLGELFAPDPRASAIGLPAVPLDDLFAIPTRSFLEARGGAVVTRASARVMFDGSSVTGVRIGDAVVTAPVVISAVAWHAFGRLFGDTAPMALRGVLDHAAHMPSSPIVTVNLWLDDADELPGAFIGLVGGPMHWIFAKSQLFGGPVEHLSVVASGAVELLRQENAEVTAAAHAQISRAVPALARSKVRRAVVVREPRATFSLAPDAPPRPATRTGLTGFFLAGDWTDTGLPGTIEGAVQSGFTAAAAAASP